jgi:hypothetical protein
VDARLTSRSMDVLQCPECELRFRSPSELDQHLAIDHPEFHARSRSLEDIEFSAARRRKHIRSNGTDDNA